MNKGDRVRHKIKGWVGIIHSFTKYGALVDWSDNAGVVVRSTNLDNIEPIHDPEV